MDDDGNDYDNYGFFETGSHVSQNDLKLNM